LEYWGGDIPWATAKDVAAVSGRYLHHVEECITQEGLKNSAAKLQPKGTVVITARGTVGAVAQLGRAMSFNQTCYALLPSDALDDDFLFYALKGTMAEMRALTSGTVFETITTQTFDHWLIPLPPLPEQRAIAHILGTLDDKIELNRRMSETLEQMARALFKAWFIDFEPVRAKLEGRWRRGQSLPGLPAHLYDLFPDRLVESELGEIPEGWEVGRVDDAFDLTMGQSPPGTTYNEVGDGIPFYQGRADFKFRFPERRVYCTAPTRFAKAGDTLIRVRAPVGDINMASEDCAIGRGVAAARHKTGARSYTYYLMHALAEVFGRFEAEGTVFGSISKKDFHNIPCVIVTRNALEAFERLCGPLDDAINGAERESRTLAALRDALLPKLISGELRVRDAERFLKERGL
jgi:type I restriction enzyme S subunit